MTRSCLIGSRNASPARAGFTIVEVLVAITIIGILAAFLVPAVMNVMQSAKESTIIMEMKQIELALEKFKADYGFYPPTFLPAPDTDGDGSPNVGDPHVNAYGNTVAPDGSPIGIQNAAMLLRYLNKISPQHNERIGSGVNVGDGTLPGGERSRLEHWWIEVGQYMDQRTCLQFWLSGLCANKQFPLTGQYSGPDDDGNGVPDPEQPGHALYRWSDGTAPLAPHGFQTDVIGSTGQGFGLERKNYYEFKLGQTSFFDQAGVEATAGTGNAVFAMYNQGYGKTSADTSRVIIYRDHSTYDIGGQAGTTWADAYRLGPTSGAESTFPTSTSPATPYAFANPDSFQLLAPGMDGFFGPSGNIYGAEAQGDQVNRTNDAGGSVTFRSIDGLDNIANFAEGRVDKWLINVGADSFVQ